MPKVSSVSTSKKVSFYYNTADAYTATSTPRLDIEIAKIKPFSHITPTGLSITYGIRQVIVANEGIGVYLAAVDVNNIPNAASLRRHSYWQAAVYYQVHGTAANVLQMLERDSDDLWGAPPTSNMEMATRQNPQTLALLTEGYGADLTLSRLMSGTLYYTEQLVNRTWGDDACTYTSWDNVKDGMLAEEWED